MSAFLGRLSTSPLRYLLIATLLLAISCKSNNPDPVVLTSLQGSWKITNITISPAYLGATNLTAGLQLLGETCLNDVVITFNTNGTISNNSASLTSCRTATNSQLILSTFFGNNTTYVESGTQATLTSGGQNVVGTRSFTSTTATFAAPLPIDPGGNAVRTTYTVLLTKQ